MIRLLIIADRVNWAFHNRARALAKYAPIHYSVELLHYDNRPIETICWQNYDIVFCLPTGMGLKLARSFRLSAQPRPKLVLSHNSGLGRRYDQLLEAMLSADHVVINNYASWANVSHFVRPDRFNATHISNGVDTSFFRSITPIEDRPHRVIWAGSRGKMEDETDIKGWRAVLAPLQMLLDNRPKSEGWDTHYIVADIGGGFTAEQMADRYNQASYCICPSWSEGTPNYMLEAIACGCIPVTTPVGNMPEIIHDRRNGVIVPRRTGDFWKGLLCARQNRTAMHHAMREVIAEWDWKLRAPQFFALFDRRNAPSFIHN